MFKTFKKFKSWNPRYELPWKHSKAVAAELAEQIPAAKTADPKDFFDTRFLEELDRSGYIDALYR